MTVIIGASLLALVFALLVRPVNTDEAWIMVVARRVLRGEVLYRDVFFGTGPAPMWLLVGTCRLTSAQVWALRSLCAASTAATALGLQAIGHNAGLARWFTSAIVVIEVGLCSLGGVDSLYVGVTKAAALGAIACLAASTWFPMVLVAGCLAGVACSSKYTIGAAAIFGGLIMISSANSPHTGRVPRLGAFLFASLLVTVLMVIPVMAQGGLSAMLLRLGRGKASFLRHGTMGLRAGLAHRKREARSNDRLSISSALVRSVLRFESTVFASAAALVLAFVAIAKMDPSVTAIDAQIIALSLTWISIVVPRADLTHVLSGFGVAICIALLSLDQLSRRGILSDTTTNNARAVIAVWALLIVLVRVVALVGAAPHRATRHATGAKGVLFALVDLQDADDFANAVKNSTTSNCFLVGRDAPALWLVSDVKNATPYDYPMASTFGITGETDVARMLMTGSIPVAGICGETDGPNQPRTVLGALHSYFEVERVITPSSVQIARYRAEQGAHHETKVVT
jgi:hypothetical protein